MWCVKHGKGRWRCNKYVYVFVFCILHGMVVLNIQNNFHFSSVAFILTGGKDRWWGKVWATLACYHRLQPYYWNASLGFLRLLKCWECWNGKEHGAKGSKCQLCPGEAVRFCHQGLSIVRKCWRYLGHKFGSDRSGEERKRGVATWFAGLCKIKV